MEKLKYIIFIMLTFSLLCSCGEGSVAISDEKGEPIYYSGSDLSIADLNGSEGIFVLNPDGTFSPIATGFSGYVESPSASSKDRYLWWTDNETNLSKLIPTYTKGSRLVMIYNSEAALPGEYLLEKYKYLGYTVGTKFYRSDDNSMYIMTDDMLEETSAGRILLEVSDEDSYKVAAVNRKKKLPLDNVDNNLGMLLGLEKGATYNFSFYKGTKYVTFNTVADTKAMQSESLIRLENPYTKTKDGYFEINLPENLADGYYYICELGLFRVKGAV